MVQGGDRPRQPQAEVDVDSVGARNVGQRGVGSFLVDSSCSRCKHVGQACADGDNGDGGDGLVDAAHAAKVRRQVFDEDGDDAHGDDAREEGDPAVENACNKSRSNET